MKGKTHVGVGLLAVVALYNRPIVESDLWGLGIVTLASLLPDIDHPKSVINKYILPFKNKMAKVTLYICLGIVIMWYSYLYQGGEFLTSLGIISILIGISSHRNGLTHSLTGMIMFSFVAAHLGNIYNIDNVIYYFMIGYGLHLLCDMGTNRGVPLFYPFKTKNMKFPFTFKTNSKVGNTIEELILIMGLIYTVFKLPKLF